MEEFLLCWVCRYSEDVMYNLYRSPGLLGVRKEGYD